MTPYWKSADGQIYHGNVLDVLKQLPDESVQMCVTSPPYWGLRDYGNNPQTWDDAWLCDHVWGGQLSSSQFHRGGNNTDEEWKRGSRGASETEKLGCGNFCQKCNAWRGSLGLEPTPELFIKHMVQIFAEVKRVLRKDGTCWVNMGDSYSSGGRNSYDPDRVSKTSGLTNNSASISRNTPKWAKPKDLLGIPWRLAFALQADGWWLRQDIIWHKPNPMPESVTDRCTKAHEYIFLLSKSAKYYYDADAIREEMSPEQSRKNQNEIARQNKIRKNGGIELGDSMIHHKCTRKNEYFSSATGRNKRSVWTIPTQPMPEAHFATFPKKLIEPCILAGCPKNGMVLDPFLGSGTTALVSYRHDRKFIGIELSKTYLDEIAIPRIEAERKQRKLF